MTILSNVRRVAILAAVAWCSGAMASSASASTVVLADFETPQIPPYVGTGFPTNYTYDPTNVPGVTFAGAAGIQGNGSGWIFPNAPQGDQTAFLQTYDYNLDCCKGTSVGSFTVAAPGLVAGNEYNLAWYVVGRPSYGTTSYSIVDGGLTIVQTLSGPRQASWVLVHHEFVADGSDSFTFDVNLPVGLSEPLGGYYDHSIGIDDITVTPVAGAPTGQTPGTVGSPNAVPEPLAWETMLLGFFSLGAVLRVTRRGRMASAA